MQSTMNYTPRRDPIAKFTLVGAVAGVLCLAWLGVLSTPMASPTAAQDSILIATPAVQSALAAEAVPAPPPVEPTAPPLEPEQAPAEVPAMSVPTVEPSGAVVAEPPPQAAAAVQAAPLEAAYAAVIQAQADHSPRGDVAPAAPAPVEVTLPSGVVVQSPAPKEAPSPVDPNAHATQAAPLSQDYATAIQVRQSANCPAGQVFYPRTGCHATGGGGAMPWPNGR